MKYIFFALLAAVLYALNAPFSKLLLAELPPAAMAGLLYLGAGIGMAAVGLAGRLGGRKQTEKPLERTDFPYVLAMILLDIAAPILLMLGLSRTSAAAASLLNNFEIVATSLIALAVFREKISPRLWAAIGLVTISCALLSAEDVILGGETLEFSAGLLFVLGACICWGIENNCTGKLSEKDPLQVVVVKGIFSGIGSLVTAWLTGETIPLTLSIIGALILGFVAYGLSIYFYVSAQRGLGAAKTSAYYAVAPFVGSGISLVLYREIPSIIFLGALAVMIAGTVLASGAGKESEMKDRILVAMSGGVDSSVAAYLIKSQGLDAVGVTLKLFSNEDIELDRDKTCCSLSDAEDARSVATRLGMEHHVFNFSDGFKENVIDRFIDTYKSGGTPNPCIDCNRFIKWRQLLTRADLMECSHIATGHYARIRQSESGRMLLMRSADPTKDQTYVLWALTQEQLARTILPLGGMTKDEVREIAESQGFLNADKPDSQDICFVPDGDYAGFIERYTGEIPKPGDFIDADGSVLGRHRGIIRYTVGQRKGLGLAMGRPVFVTGIRPADNTVVIGDEPALFRRELAAHDINLIAISRIDSPMRVSAKIRYGKREAPATVEQTGEDSLRVVFDEPQRAITRGQSLVLYDGDVVIGGGIIDG